MPVESTHAPPRRINALDATPRKARLYQRYQYHGRGRWNVHRTLLFWALSDMIVTYGRV